MEAAALGRVPVTDDKGYFIGVVTMDEIIKLDEILDVTSDPG